MKKLRLFVLAATIISVAAPALRALAMTVIYCYRSWGPTLGVLTFRWRSVLAP